MTELADVQDLGSCAARRMGSSPTIRSQIFVSLFTAETVLQSSVAGQVRNKNVCRETSKRMSGMRHGLGAFLFPVSEEADSCCFKICGKEFQDNTALSDKIQTKNVKQHREYGKILERP